MPNTMDTRLSVLVWLGFLFFKTNFLCSPGYPETHSVDQAGLKLGDLYPLPPSAGIKAPPDTDFHF